MKKVLVFHQGKPPHGVRTQWIMHEYRLASPDQTLASSTSPQRKNSIQVRFPLFDVSIFLANWDKKEFNYKFASSLVCLCVMVWSGAMYVHSFSLPFEIIFFWYF